MKNRHKRALWILLGLAVIGIAAALILNAFQSNLVFFFSPSQVASKEAPVGRVFRVGGMLKEGSVQKNGLQTQFVITDFAAEVPVSYTGILPDLFMEGKGVVAQGRLDQNGQFQAQEVLAKHDENYMPPEAKSALDEAAKAKMADSVK